MTIYGISKDNSGAYRCPVCGVMEWDAWHDCQKDKGTDAVHGHFRATADAHPPGPRGVAGRAGAALKAAGG